MKMLNDKELQEYLEAQARKMNEAMQLPEDFYNADDVIRIIVTLDKRQADLGNPTIIESVLDNQKADCKA